MTDDTQELPSQWRVLLIEDDVDHAWLIKKDIREAGLASTILHASDLLAAKPLFRTEAFDVVLLDLNLPGNTIEETLSTVMAWAAGTPVVVLTSVDDIQLGVKAISEGAQDYLVKLDITSAILARTLRYAIERAAAQRHLHELTSRLRRVNLELDSFSSIVAHDFRSPVGRLKWYIDLLKGDEDSSLSPEAQKSLDVIGQQADRMERMIADLWAYSKFGGQTEPTVDVDIGELAAGIFEMLDRPNEFQLQTAGEMPTIATHRAAIELVIRNLVTNSIAHRGDSQGEVVLSANQNGDWVEVTVRDNGLGLSPMLAEQLQTARRHSQNGGARGLGLGLTVVQRLVDRYGGRICVDPDASGAVIRFTWPRSTDSRTHGLDDC